MRMMCTKEFLYQETGIFIDQYETKMHGMLTLEVIEQIRTTGSLA